MRRFLCSTFLERTRKWHITGVQLTCSSTSKQNEHSSMSFLASLLKPSSPHHWTKQSERHSCKWLTPSQLYDISVKFFPNLTECALHLNCRRNDHLQQEISSDGSGVALTTTTATEAAQGLLQGLEQVRFTYSDQRNAISRSSFHRMILEQIFLELYVLLGISSIDQRHRLQRLWRPLYLIPIETVSTTHRCNLESSLNCLLRSTAYSMHLAAESLIRQKETGLALECVTLWWWSNPDQMPIELPYSERLLPFTWHGGSVASTLESYLCQHRQNTSYLEKSRSEGGFLCPSAILGVGYRTALATQIKNIASPKNFVSCALTFRFIEMAMEEMWGGRNGDRSYELVQQLLLEWIIPLLCEEARLPVTKRDFEEMPSIKETASSWLFYSSCIGASTFLMLHWKECRLSGASSYSKSRDFSNLKQRFIQKCTSLFFQNSQEKLPQDVDAVVRLCELAFSVTEQSFKDGGAFHVVRPASSAWVCECWVTSVAQNCSQFFSAETITTTLWILFIFECIAASRPANAMALQFIGQEEALESWVRTCQCTIERSNGIALRMREWVGLQNKRARNVFDESGEDLPLSAAAARPDMVPSTFCFGSQYGSDGRTPSEVVISARDSIIRVFLCFLSTTFLQEVSAYASFPSGYVLLRFVHLLCYIGCDAASAARIASGPDPVLECIRQEIIPHAHGGLGGYMRRLEVLYLTHSGEYGAKILLEEKKRSILDHFSTTRAWEIIGGTLLWSGLPSNATYHHLLVDGKLVDFGTVNSLSFGRGSLAWELLGLLCPSTSLLATEIKHADLLRFRLLREALSHLLHLSVAVPEAAPQLLSLSPLHNIINQLTTSRSSKLERNAETDVRLSQEDGGVAEERQLDGNGGGNLEYGFDFVDGELTEKQCTEVGNEEALPVTVPVNNTLNATLKDSGGDGGAGSTPENVAESQIAAAFSTVSYPSRHLFLSLLDVVKWWTDCATIDDAYMSLLEQWELSLKRMYKCRITQQRMKTESRGFIASSIVSSVLQISLYTCPDSVLIATGVILIHFQYCETATSKRCKPPRSSSVLPKYLESALCRFFYHCGLNRENVNAWLREETREFGIAATSLGLETEMIERQEHLLDRVMQSLDDNSFSLCSFGIDFLLRLSASITLRSLNRKAAEPRSFYASSFAAACSSSTVPVIFPSLQLYARHPSRPRQEYRPLRHFKGHISVLGEKSTCSQYQIGKSSETESFSFL